MNRPLPVAILAGGLATRLRPLTHDLPKALVPVAGQPFAAHQLRLLAASGIRRVVYCVGHLGERIERFVGDGRRFGLDVDYSRDGEKLLGTAGAIRRALPRLDDAFLVLYGDSYLPCDYRAVERAFLRSGRVAMMTVFRNDGRWDRSNVALADDGVVRRYDKRHPDAEMRYIDYGLGAFRAEVFAELPDDQPADLADVYQRLAAAGELAGFEVAERFYEVGSFDGLRELDDFLRARMLERNVGGLYRTVSRGVA